MTNIATIQPTSEEDMNAIRRLFEGAVNTIVEASALRKEVSELRVSIAQMKADIDQALAHNRELDEMLAQTRSQRDEARVEASKAAAEVISLTAANVELGQSILHLQGANTDWENKFHQLTTDKAQIEEWYNSSQVKLGEASSLNIQLRDERDHFDQALSINQGNLDNMTSAYNDARNALAKSEAARIEAEGALAKIRDMVHPQGQSPSPLHAVA